MHGDHVMMPDMAAFNFGRATVSSIEKPAIRPLLTIGEILRGEDECQHGALDIKRFDNLVPP